MIKKLILASTNPGKIKELNQFFSPLNIEVISQSEYHISDIPETGLSFVENAIIKARHATKLSGLPALADDSGLVLPILNGAPGIYSARYAGHNVKPEQHIQKLLRELSNAKNEQRNAFFHCCLVIMTSELDPTPIICEANWYGSITTEPKGQFGFGYDPIFYVPDYDMTAAEMKLELKNQISHRAMALKKLYQFIKRM